MDRFRNVCSSLRTRWADLADSSISTRCSWIFALYSYKDPTKESLFFMQTFQIENESNSPWVHHKWLLWNGRFFENHQKMAANLQFSTNRILSTIPMRVWHHFCLWFHAQLLITKAYVAIRDRLAVTPFVALISDRMSRPIRRLDATIPVDTAEIHTLSLHCVHHKLCGLKWNKKIVLIKIWPKIKSTLQTKLFLNKNKSIKSKEKNAKIEIAHLSA